MLDTREPHPLANVGDVNSEEKGSGARFNKGKAPLEYIPLYQFVDWIGHLVDLDNQEHVDILNVLDFLSDWQRGASSSVLEYLRVNFSDFDMIEAALVWQYGARKYAPWNWAKGMAWSVPVACIMRHAMAVIVDEQSLDPESGKSHWAHIVCNLQMLAHFEIHYPQGDDRPPKEIW